MIPILISIPIMAVLVIFQSAVLSRMPLLQGMTDLVMITLVAWALQERVQTHWHWAVIGGLMASLWTALPFGTLLAAYLAVTGMALLLKRRVWKAPILAMLATVFLGTLVVQGLSLLAISLGGTLLPIGQVLNLVVLPSLLLNLLLSLPAFILMRDLANWFYPEGLEV